MFLFWKRDKEIERQNQTIRNLMQTIRMQCVHIESLKDKIKVIEKNNAELFFSSYGH